MKRSSRVILVVGSPRADRSNSESLGTYLLDKLKEAGFQTEKNYIYSSMASVEGYKKLMQSVDESDILLLAFPVYWDAPPSLVMNLLEIIARHRLVANIEKKHSMVVIVQSGLPEASHGAASLEICQRFAKETGINWAGGLVFGGGQILHQKSLAEAGFAARNAKKSMDMTALMLAEDKPVPKEAVDLMASNSIPSWAYTLSISRLFRKLAKENGVQNRLLEMPYQVKLKLKVVQ